MSRIKIIKNVALVAGAIPAIAMAQVTSSEGSSTTENSLGTVTVTGTAPGAETEHTGSYTTGQTAAATKLPLSIRETPQSVSVMTRQRMDDQQLTSVQSVLQNATGISASAYDSERVNYYSRGFQIDSYQFDGIPTTSVNGSGFLDTAFYDRIEVVRGATGLLTGAGNPSASINLIRKRPTKQFSASASVSAGSWDNYRAVADISTPLNKEGTVRGRFVGLYQDRHSYLDYYRQRREGAYGIIEADITSSTILSVGYDYQDIKPRGTTWAGLPLWFSNGTSTNWDVSKSPATDWSRYENTISNGFASLEHFFDNGWTGKAIFNQQRVNSHARYFSVSGYPNQTTGLGMTATALGQNTSIKQDSIDVMATGPFSLFGRNHELVIGAMTSKRTTNDESTGYIYPTTAIGNFYNWSGHYPEPDWDAYGYKPTDTVIRQSGLYGAARFSLADPLKVIVGGRVSRYDIAQKSTTTTFNYRRNGEVTPYVGILYDLNKTYTAYASYTAIFNPQNYRDRNNQVLAPTKGKNKEVGLKGEYLDGRVNASLSVFDTRLDNVAQSDTGQRLPDGTQAYYAAQGTKSQGYDFEIQGELLRNWNLSLGISHFTASDSKGARLSTTLPRTTARLFSTYRFDGDLNNLTVGGGVNWQSMSYQSSSSPSGTTNVVQQPYALVSLLGRYKINQNVDLSLNVNNLFDKRYTLMNGFYGQVLYGEPRNFMLTLNYKM
ncbi:TonB-dependent siderophore receptor [Herbaspirillum sp. LeCh32-8]|uniref:TonB-dependent siderophore receptor n=1 Tax=Herbaspirillum sp. LeCh32-8 TaxID=2821356 RepID=UPI001FD75E51|nr:TonB-dependent siderophore receptor [Herbaspirillum sp. LeCh32-8]